MQTMRKLMRLVEVGVREAYLYHGTELVSAIQIVRDDELWGTTEKEHLPHAVSTSRDPRFAHEVSQWFDRQYPVVFVLDRNKLAQRYAIRPHSDKTQAGQSWQGSNQRGIEAEERVIGGIAPLESVLVSINVDPQDIRRARSEIDFWVGEELFPSKKAALTALRAFARHPKLNAIPLRLSPNHHQ